MNSTGQHAMPVRAELPNGVELHFMENGQGPAVILLHGGMGDCHSWAPQMDALSPRFRVIAYSRRHNNPNQNHTQGTAQPLHLDVDDLLALERVLQIGAAHLVATSYGALVALMFALEHPAKVLSLVLAEPPLHRWACRTPVGARLYAAFMEEVWRPAAEAFERGHDRHALQLLADGIWGRAIFDSLTPQRLAAALRNAGAMKALTQAPDPFPDLAQTAVAQLAIPTLLVHGEHASELHVRVIEELARAMPDAARAVIAGAGHGSPLENPDGFNDALLGFVALQ